MKNMKLCVAIPTYNRKEKLERTLRLLEKQSRDDFDIVISDNHSDYDIEKMVGSFPREFRDRILLYKNRYNVGMSGNIASLFEKANSEWAWFLSDDDLPNENAIDTIYSDIDRYSSQGVSVIQYPHFEISREISNEYIMIDNLAEYIDYFKSLLHCGKTLIEVEGTLVYMSNKVYRISNLANYIRYAYDYCNTGIPQVIPVIKALDDGQVRMLVHNALIVNTDPNGERSWGVQGIALGLSTICNMPLNVDERRRIELWYLLMIRFKLVLEDYMNKGINDYDYLHMLYNNVYRYILKPEHVKYYEEVLEHAIEKTEIPFLKKTFTEVH